MSDHNDERNDEQQPTNPNVGGAGPDQIGRYREPTPDTNVPRVQSDEERQHYQQREGYDPRVIPDEQAEQEQREAEEQPERTTLEKVLAGEEYDMTSVSELYCEDGNRPVPWSIINAIILHMEGKAPPPPEAGRREDEQDERGQ